MKNDSVSALAASAVAAGATLPIGFPRRPEIGLAVDWGDPTRTYAITFEYFIGQNYFLTIDGRKVEMGKVRVRGIDPRRQLVTIDA